MCKLLGLMKNWNLALHVLQLLYYGCGGQKHEKWDQQIWKINFGVRHSLIPVLVNYLQDRTMTVKWNGVTSSERKLNGGGPQGATFGLWEYLAQSNNSADCVDPQYRFKFVDDLTILEKVNLLLVGLASHNCHSSVPSDVPVHNQVIPAQHLKSSLLSFPKLLICTPISL